MSIFFFLEDNDTLAKQLVFFTVYAFIGIFYLFKSFYYRRHKATFNELFFVVGIPLLPPLFVILGEVTGVNTLYFSDLLSATLVLQNEPMEFSLAFASIMALPYFFFAMYLLLRSFIRYQFIRWQAHSKGGPPGTFIGILLAGFIGIIYLVVALFFADFLLLLFGFMYSLVGILSFLG